MVCYLFSHSDLQVKVSYPDPTHLYQYPALTMAELECHSMCGLAGDPTFIWFWNGHNVGQGVNFQAYSPFGGSYSCAVKGYEHLRSPLVCKSTPYDPRCNGPFKGMNYMSILQ